MNAPSLGSLWPSSMRYLAIEYMKGSTRAASKRKIAVFSDFDFEGFGCSPGVAAVGFVCSDTRRLSLVHEVCAERLELFDDVLIAAPDETDVAHRGLPLGDQRCDEVAEAAAQVGNEHIRAVQRGGPRDDR